MGKTTSSPSSFGPRGEERGRLAVLLVHERADEVLEVLTGDCELPRWDVWRRARAK